MSMLQQEFNETIRLLVRRQLEVIDTTAWIHWSGTGHAVALNMNGWTCPECPEEYVMPEIQWR